ncbi:YIP1 family protein, partial [Bacillus sp. JJ353]
MEANLEKNPVKSPSIFGIFTSPGEQFERIKTKPAIWGPLLLVLVLTVVGAVYTAVGTNYDAIFKESGLTGEELEIVRPLAVGGAIFGTIFIQIATVFIAP